MANRKSFTEEIKRVAEMKGRKEERIAARDELLLKVLEHMMDFVYPCSDMEMPILAATMQVIAKFMQDEMEVESIRVMEAAYKRILENSRMKPNTVYTEWEKVCD